MLQVSAGIWPYLFPVLVWGGLLHYPLLLYLVVLCRFGAAAFLAAAAVLLITCRRTMAGTLNVYNQPRYTYAGDDMTVGTTQPTINFVHPHGLFTEVVTTWMCSGFPGQTSYDKQIILIDFYLYYFSPMTGMIITMASGCQLGPLSHRQIQQHLIAGRSIYTSAGGFMEATDMSDHHENLYIHMYSYWMWLARSNPSYRIRSIFAFNQSTRHFTQSPVLLNTRLSLARRSIPGILPTGLSKTPSCTPVHLNVLTINPHTDTLQSIADTMLSKVTAVDLASGVRFGVCTTA
jgi:hypothetical protein